MSKKIALNKTLFEVVLLVSTVALFLIIFGSFFFDPFVILSMYIFYMGARYMIQNHVRFDCLGFFNYASN